MKAINEIKIILLVLEMKLHFMLVKAICAKNNSLNTGSLFTYIKYLFSALRAAQWSICSRKCHKVISGDSTITR